MFLNILFNNVDSPVLEENIASFFMNVTSYGNPVPLILRRL